MTWSQLVGTWVGAFCENSMNQTLMIEAFYNRAAATHTLANAHARTHTLANARADPGV